MEARGLRSLRRTAEETVLREVRVTPDLKARLMERVLSGEAEAEPEPVRPSPARPGWRRGPWASRLMAGLVAAAALALALQSRIPELPRTGPGEQAAEGLDREGLAGPAQRARPSDTTTLRGRLPDENKIITNGSAAKLNVTVMDAAGSRADSLSSNITFSTAAASGAPGVEAQPGRQIILNAEYSLRVTDARAALASLQNLANGAGGYVTDATLARQESGAWAGRVVLRVPSGGYGGAIEAVRQAGEVLQERQWTQDVTEQYQDTERRLRIQQEMEVKLQELASRAATFEDWLKLTQQINETRAQIETMQGNLKKLSNQVAYSTIAVGLNQPAPRELPAAAAPGQGLASQMSRSFERSLWRLAGWGRELLLGLAAAAPLLVPAGLIGLGLWLRRRRRAAAPAPVPAGDSSAPGHSGPDPGDPTSQ